MKTVYLHIGTTKTGSSAIQRFLKQNREILQQHGYCFPETLTPFHRITLSRNAHFLIGKMYREDGSRDMEQEAAVLQAGMENVRNCLKDFDSVILSDESIYRVSSGSFSSVFPYLKEDSEKYGYNVKIIVYLRRQDEYLISTWNQGIKVNKPTPAAGTSSAQERIAWLMKGDKYLAHYGSKLDEMAAIFGKENLIVRRYAPQEWENGSVIHDFLHCIGLEFSEDFLPLTSVVNNGLQGNTVEIKRIINKDTSFTEDETIWLGDFLRDLGLESGKRYPSSPLSCEEIRALLKNFEEDNDYVAKSYFNDGKPLFSDTIRELPKWDPDNPYMTEDVIRFFSSVCVGLHRENESLRQELRDFRANVNVFRTNMNSFRYKLKHPVRALFQRLFHHDRQDGSI